MALADAGADAIAGLADLDDTTHLSPAVRRRYQTIGAAGIDAGGADGERVEGREHRHVYGANLGVRADAYVVAVSAVGVDRAR